MKINKVFLSTDINAYSDAGAANKELFHKESKKFLKNLASDIGLTNTNDFDIRSNKAGIAVSGEITLHSDNIYVQISSFGSPNILYRTCNGRKDYSGDSNNHINMRELYNNQDEYPRLVSTIKRMIDTKISKSIIETQAHPSDEDLSQKQPSMRKRVF